MRRPRSCHDPTLPNAREAVLRRSPRLDTPTGRSPIGVGFADAVTTTPGSRTTVFRGRHKLACVTHDPSSRMRWAFSRPSRHQTLLFEHRPKYDPSLYIHTISNRPTILYSCPGLHNAHRHMLCTSLRCALAASSALAFASIYTAGQPGAGHHQNPSSTVSITISRRRRSSILCQCQVAFFFSSSSSLCSKAGAQEIEGEE